MPSKTSAKVGRLSAAQNTAAESIARKVTRKASEPEPARTGHVVRANGAEQRRITLYLPTAIARELLRRSAEQDRSLSAVGAEYLAKSMGMKVPA